MSVRIKKEYVWRAGVVALISLLPSITFGAEFAKQSLFLSQSSVTEGDTVLIHAVISNDTNTPFMGKLIFTDGNIAIGSVPVSLAAEEASTLSISWKPSAGSHNISAQLDSTTGATVENETATVVVANKPVPLSAVQTGTTNTAAVVDSSQPIQNSIAHISPTVAQDSQPVFTTIDSLRQKGADLVNAQLAATKKSMAQKPQTTSSEISAQTATGYAEGIYIFLLGILLSVLSSAGLFYPILAVLFFYILWRTYRRFRRPAWQR